MKQTHLLLLIGIVLFLCYCNRDKIEAFGGTIEAFGNQLIVPQFEFAILTPDQDPMSGYFQEEICSDDATWKKGDKKCIDYSMDRDSCLDKGDNGKSAMDACPVSCDSCPSSVKIKKREPSPVEDVEEPDYAVFDEVMNLDGGGASGVGYRELYEKIDDINERLDEMLNIESVDTISPLCARFECDPNTVKKSQGGTNAHSASQPNTEAARSAEGGAAAAAAEAEAEQESGSEEYAHELLQEECCIQVPAPEPEDSRQGVVTSQAVVAATPNVHVPETVSLSLGEIDLYSDPCSDLLQQLEAMERRACTSQEDPDTDPPTDPPNCSILQRDNLRYFKNQCFSGGGIWGTCKNTCCENNWFPFSLPSNFGASDENVQEVTHLGEEWNQFRQCQGNVHEEVDAGGGSPDGSAGGSPGGSASIPPTCLSSCCMAVHDGWENSSMKFEDGTPVFKPNLSHIWPPSEERHGDAHRLIFACHSTRQGSRGVVRCNENEDPIWEETCTGY